MSLYDRVFVGSKWIRTMKQSFASAARLRGSGNPFLCLASKPGSKAGSATLMVVLRAPLFGKTYVIHERLRATPVSPAHLTKCTTIVVVGGSSGFSVIGTDVLGSRGTRAVFKRERRWRLTMQQALRQNPGLTATTARRFLD